MYNTTYRVVLAGQARPLILGVAPAPERQFRIERGLMRNEHEYGAAEMRRWYCGLDLLPGGLGIGKHRTQADGRAGLNCRA